MITSTTRIKIGDNALMQKVSDEMVILDSQSGQYYTLNDMATEMLEHLQNGRSIEEVSALICKEYEVSKAEVNKDLTSMVNTLLEKQLVISE
ncbi:PqqD family protein [Glaciecola siphonariae]|uniref:PqqD family protein n=1 Tax=Glaciecola siphonariae TaxID=521012 RepID=A0ABV9LXX4_9ALTE